MAIHNIFHAGEGCVTAACGPNAWSMYPRPDIVCDKEYKGPGQYQGYVTRRLAGPSQTFVSDGGFDPVIRYLRGVTFAANDELAMILVPRHWSLMTVQLQVYVQADVFGTDTGMNPTAATGQNAVFDVILRTPACPTVGTVAGDVVLAAAVPTATAQYARYAVPAASEFSAANRLLVLKFTTPPADWTKVNFELTARMENVRDIGRPT